MARGDSRMAAGVKIRTEFSAAELRRLAAASKHANQSRHLLSSAAVLDGMSRADAARIGGMDRQTLRDGVHRFNSRGGSAAELERDGCGHFRQWSAADETC